MHEAKIEILKEKVSINGVIESCIHMHKYTAEQKKIYIDFKPSSKPL